jgi:hypothetical protein
VEFGALKPPVDRVRRWRQLAAITAVIVLVSLAGWWWRSRGSTMTPVSTAAPAVDSLARAPDGVRILVRVVNASGAGDRSVARRAALHLRALGYDVVDFDWERKGVRDSTSIVVHTDHPDWGQRLQRALGVGVVSATSDPLRDIDVTVLLGRDWIAPTEPLRP